MTLPLPLRNRLAELILDSLHDPTARTVLSMLVRFCHEPERLMASPGVPAEFPLELFDNRAGRLALKGAYRRFEDEFCERTVRAWEVVRDRPLAGRDPGLADVLDEAADLFDARLFFEVHELLEPYWMRADGAAREALQGLIQIAVGFQHLANHNLDGALMLLEEGLAKVEGKKLEGRDLGRFAAAVGGARGAIVALGKDAPWTFDWGVMPRFPRGG